jgi:oligopeptide transport system ATP-binding protein
MSRVLQVSGLGMPFDASERNGAGLEGIDFALETGQVLGVVGESGSGKTTLARALAGLRPIGSGSIQVMGEDLSPSGLIPRHLRHQVQMVFQNPVASLDPRMTVLQSLEEPLKVHQPEMPGDQRRTRAGQVLDMVGLPATTLSGYPHQFSGGQCQRIAIARSLMVQPSLLICDEVVSALDVSVQAQVLNLLMSLQRELGLAMVFISHDLAVVRHISDRILVIYRGRLLERGPAGALCVHPAHPYTRDLLAAVPGAGPAQNPRPVAVAEALPGGCSYRHRCELASPACREAAPGLADVAGDHQVACHHPLINQAL